MTIVHSIVKAMEIRRTYPETISWWTGKIINAIRAGDCETAAKFAGRMSHLIGDTGQAAHLLDYRLDLRELIPSNQNCDMQFNQITGDNSALGSSLVREVHERTKSKKITGAMRKGMGKISRVECRYT